MVPWEKYMVGCGVEVPKLFGVVNVDERFGVVVIGYMLNVEGSLGFEYCGRRGSGGALDLYKFSERKTRPPYLAGESIDQTCPDPPPSVPKQLAGGA